MNTKAITLAMVAVSFATIVMAMIPSGATTRLRMVNVSACAAMAVTMMILLMVGTVEIGHLLMR